MTDPVETVLAHAVAAAASIRAGNPANAVAEMHKLIRVAASMPLKEGRRL